LLDTPLLNLRLLYRKAARILNDEDRTMLAHRRRLPNRRGSVAFAVEIGGLRFTCTASRYLDGDLGEVFITNHKAGSTAGIMASDAAVVCSIALQYGVPLEVIRRALMRDGQGRPSGPLGVALDVLAADDGGAP
jgi:hypothetical protein